MTAASAVFVFYGCHHSEPEVAVESVPHIGSADIQNGATAPIFIHISLHLPVQ
jgi:hypothetical protein